MADGSCKPDDQKLIAAYIAKNGVTHVKPAYCARVSYALSEAELSRRLAAFIYSSPARSATRSASLIAEMQTICP